MAHAETGSRRLIHLAEDHDRVRQYASLAHLAVKLLGLATALADPDPVIIFEHKLLYGSKGPRTEKGALSPVGEVPDADYVVPIGKGIIRRPGKDVTIIGKLLTMYRALAGLPNRSWKKSASVRHRIRRTIGAISQ